MTITIDEFDAMPEAEAAFKLAACCGSSTWVSRMMERRPFRSRDHLFNEADAVAQSLRDADWLEAFSHHPRIGDVAGLRERFASTARSPSTSTLRRNSWRSRSARRCA